MSRPEVWDQRGRLVAARGLGSEGQACRGHGSGIRGVCLSRPGVWDQRGKLVAARGLGSEG